MVNKTEHVRDALANIIVDLVEYDLDPNDVNDSDRLLADLQLTSFDCCSFRCDAIKHFDVRGNYLDKRTEEGLATVADWVGYLTPRIPESYWRQSA